MSRAYSALLSLIKNESFNDFLDPRMSSEFLPKSVQEETIGALRESGIDGDIVTLCENTKSTMMKHSKEFISSVKRIKGLEGDFELIDFGILETYRPSATVHFEESDNSYAICVSSSYSTIFQKILLAAKRAVLSTYTCKTRKELKDALFLLLFTIDTFINDDYKTGINVPTRILSNQTIELLRATKEHWMLTADMAQLFTNFIIAHELGHIALGHINNKNSCSHTLSNMEAEYQADEWGWNALLDWLKDRPENQVIAIEVPNIHFTINSIVEKYNLPETRQDETYSRTHPPATERAERLRILSNKRIADGKNDKLDYFRRISKILSDASKCIKGKK